jgi:hypothetical protein
MTKLHIPSDTTFNRARKHFEFIKTTPSFGTKEAHNLDALLRICEAHNGAILDRSDLEAKCALEFVGSSLKPKFGVTWFIKSGVIVKI